MDKERITNFLFELASLRRLTRSHRQFLPNVTDNIGDHSFRVAVIGYLLAKMEKVDENKVIKICLFHDVLEARTGDFNFVNKQYATTNNRSVRDDQFSSLPFSKEMTDLLEEYEDRLTAESVVAKDADLLDQMVLQQEYLFKDEVNLKRWQDHSEKSLKTDSAKQIAANLRLSNPLEWLYRLAADKTGYQPNSA